MTEEAPGKGKAPVGFEPRTTAEYLEPDYWEERFKKEDQYDWFKTLSEFRHLLLPHLKQSDKILILGCGNSTMTFDLWNEGFRDITSIDLSEVVISRMEEKSKEKPGLKWRVADMLDLPFGDGTFDVVMEKGTMDVLFVDNDSPWDPDPAVCRRVHQMLRQIHSAGRIILQLCRILTNSGVFLSVTFAQPHFRRPFFQASPYTWTVQHDSFGETFHYFVYNLRKGARTESNADAGWETRRPKSAADYGKEHMTHEHMDQEGYLLSMDL